MRKSILFLGALLLVAASCSKYDAVTALKPTSFVILDAPTRVVKGDTISVVFRMNPSGSVPTMDNMQLDAVQETIYLVVNDKQQGAADSAPETKGNKPYTQTPEHFKLIDIAPCTDEEGNTLTGQWVADIAASNDASQNFFDVAQLALVMQYNTTQGKTQYVSSPIFDLTLVPTLEEGLLIWNPTYYNYQGCLTQTHPFAFIALDGKKYENQANKSDFMYYSLTEDVSGITNHLDPAYQYAFDVQQVAEKEDNAYLTFTPQPGDSKWDELMANVDNTLSIADTLLINDAYGHSMQVATQFVYVARNEMDFTFDLNHAVGKYEFDVTDALGQCGYFPTDFANLRRANTSISISSGEGYWGRLIAEDGRFLLQVNVYEALTPGEILYNPENTFFRLMVTTYPSPYLSTAAVSPLDLKVNLKAVVF